VSPRGGIGLDAIVVGAGPNGLAAAITLARAGRSVRVYEAAEQVGGGTRTMELTLPGFRHDMCSTILPLTLASPFFTSIDLAARGVEIVHPDARRGLRELHGEVQQSEFSWREVRRAVIHLNRLPLLVALDHRPEVFLVRFHSVHAAVGF